MEKTKYFSIENSANLSNETFKEIFYKMWEIRFFDEKVDELFARGLIHGTTHLAVGQEATAAGSSAVLKRPIGSPRPIAGMGIHLPKEPMSTK